MCKSQCQSIKGKVVADLGRSGKEHGLNYISFYRATIFGDFGIFNEITRNRLINSFFQHKKIILERLTSKGCINLEMSPGQSLEG